MKHNKVIIFFSLLLVMVFLALAARCFYLQYYKTDYYLDRSIRQQRSLQIWQPQRGPILDARGRILAASNSVQTIFVEPRIIDDPRDTANELAPVVDIGAHIICQTIRESKNPGFVKIKTTVDANESDAVRRIPGVGVQSQWQRSYPMGRLTGSVVGFTSRDNYGLEGIELKYDQDLRGSESENIFLADVRRRPIRLKEQNGTLTNGVGVILTIDAAIQQFTRDELVKQYESFEAESAIAIVAEPKSGAILAMVSIPDFDPENIGKEDPNNFRNRALTDPFEPGSMIKPIVIAIAVDNDVIKKNDVIFCENGNYSGKYNGKSFGRVKEYRNHRFVDLKIREVLVKSSNIGMAKIGQKMGPEILYNGLKLFGYGDTTDIELPGEVGGLLRTTDKWTGYSVTRIPYGYEINVTALQMLQAYCILANGGRLVKPHLVKAIVDNNGEIIQIKQPAPPVGYIIQQDIANWMIQDCLVGVVNEKSNGGTGWRAKLDKWQVFGKTGTANIARIGLGGYDENSNIASFVAGAPAENPAVIVFVSIRRPNGKLGKGDSGGVVASPVAGRIIEKTLNYLGVEPTLNNDMVADGRLR